MCRHLAYLGADVPLADVLLDPPFGLLRQSWAPREMRGTGTVNADGFGVGWYVREDTVPGSATAPPATPSDVASPGYGRNRGRDEPESASRTPVRYRRPTPLWSDPSFADLARATRAGAFLAAVRSATVGMPVIETACAPFTDGPWLFSHNGVVSGWPHSVAGLAGRLPVAELLTLDAPIDSALVWALVRGRLRDGTDPGKALAEAVRDLEAAAPGSRLNLLLTDGTRMWATTRGHSLSVRRGTGSVIIASEPHDETPEWKPIPDRRLVTADRSAYTVEEL